MTKENLKVVSIIFGKQPSSYVRAITREKVAHQFSVNWVTIDLEADLFVSRVFRTFKYSRSFLRLCLIPLNLFRNTQKLRNADVIYVIKFPPLWFSLIVKYFCKVVIYDYDDPMWLKQFVGERKFKRHLECYGGFTCDNELQLSKGREHNRNGLVIEGIVPIFDRNTPKKQKKIRIIWIGSRSTQMYLRSIRQALLQVIDSNDFVSFTFLGVARADIAIDNSRVSYIENYDEAQMQKELRRADIGLFPLLDDELSSARGVHKMNIYFASGIPVIASPSLLINTGLEPGSNGYICESIDEWHDALMSLIADESLLMEMKKRIQTEHDGMARNYDSTQKLVNFFRENIEQAKDK